jgi:hypothetical protein
MASPRLKARLRFLAGLRRGPVRGNPGVQTEENI